MITVHTECVHRNAPVSMHAFSYIIYEIIRIRNNVGARIKGNGSLSFGKSVLMRQVCRIPHGDWSWVTTPTDRESPSNRDIDDATADHRQVVSASSIEVIFLISGKVKKSDLHSNYVLGHDNSRS